MQFNDSGMWNKNSQKYWVKSFSVQCKPFLHVPIAEIFRLSIALVVSNTSKTATAIRAAITNNDGSSTASISIEACVQFIPIIT